MNELRCSVVVGRRGERRDLGFSSPFRGQLDGDSAAAEVDHGDERGGCVVAVATVVDEADLAVESFELRVRQPELDSGEDPVAVGADRSRQRDERGDATAARPRQPPVEVHGGVLFGVAEPEQVAQALFELPAPVEDRTFAAERVEGGELAVVEPRRGL